MRAVIISIGIGAFAGMSFFAWSFSHSRQFVISYAHPHFPFHLFVRQTYEGIVVAQNTEQSTVTIQVENSREWDLPNKATNLTFTYTNSTVWGTITYHVKNGIVITRSATTTAPRRVGLGTPMQVLMDTSHDGTLSALTISITQLHTL